MFKKITSAALAVASLFTACFSLSGCGATSLSLDDYIHITVDGYDGYGSAYYSCNTDQFIQDYANVKFTKEGQEQYPYIEEPVDVLAGYLFSSGTLDSTKGTVSNGDEITFDWGISDEEKDEIESLFDVKLKFDDITIKAEGLEEVDTFDAFENVGVRFEGTSPDGTAVVEANGKVSADDFTVEPAEGLANGDTVTVTLGNDADYYLDIYGAVPAEFSREYEVTGLPYFVTALSEIPADGLEKMKQQATDAYNSWVAKDWSEEYETLKSFDFLGCYFLTPKEGFSSSFENQIYLIFEPHITQHGKDENGNVTDSEFSYYTYYCFYNGEIIPDGTFSIDYSDYGSCPNRMYSPIVYDYTQHWSWNQEHEMTLYGYDGIDSLFNQVVTVNIEKCDYESSVEV